MTLGEWQQSFRSWLTTASPESAEHLGAGAMAGLDVYQNNYRGQLVSCLEDAFPNVRKWTGDEIFHQAVIAHIDSHPPHAWTLDAYPGGFGQTLAALFPNNPDLQELAWIELSLSEAFVAADAEPVSLDALATVNWDTAHLSLTPSLRSRVMTTNAESIWSALWEQTPVPDGAMLDVPAGLIIWRRAFTSRLKQVDALELEALLQLQQHGHFGTLCEWLVEGQGDNDGLTTAGNMLANWLAGGLIIAVEET